MCECDPWVREDLNDVRDTIDNILNALVTLMVKDVPCTCGFGGEHHELRESCQRNMEFASTKRWLKVQ